MLVSLNYLYIHVQLCSIMTTLLLLIISICVYYSNDPPPSPQHTDTFYSGASRPMKIPNPNPNNPNPNSLLNNNPNLNNNLNNNNPNNINTSHSQGTVKDPSEVFLYGQSYPLLAPIGSEHAASMLYDKVGAC